MAFYAQLGDNWDYREIQRQVEETYFQVQECWRRMDVSYGAPYLSQELMEEFDSKIQWMQVRGENLTARSSGCRSGENGGYYRRSNRKMRWI